MSKLKLPVSTDPSFTPLPPPGVPLTRAQSDALFRGDCAAVARRVYQGILADLEREAVEVDQKPGAD